MSLIKQLAGETVLYGFGQILPRVIYFLIFSSYLTYRLNDSPGEYAIYLDLYAYASVLIIVCSYRMDTAFFRYGSKSDMAEVFKTALLPLVLSSVLVVGLAFMYAEDIAALLTYPGRGYYVIWFAIIIAFDVIALLPMARLRLQSRAKLFVSFKVANVLITILFVLFFLELLPRFASDFMGGLRSFVKSDIDYVFLSNLIASALMLFGLLFVFPIRSGKVNWPLWRKMVGYAWPLVIVGIAGSINQFFGVPLQKYFLGADFAINKDEAGVYGAVQKIPALLAMFTTAYNYAAEPFFFKNAEEKDAKTLYGDIALFFTMAAGFIAVGIYLFIDVLQFVIGSGYREAIYLVPILLMSYLFLGIYYNVSIWYKLSDNTKYGALIASVGAVITIAGSIIFLPTIGVAASAYTALACYTTMVLLAYVIGQRIYPINYPLASIIKMILWILIIMILGAALKTDSMILNLILGMALTLVYATGCYFFEKDKIRKYLFSS